jgi:hypothetical protein
MDRTNENKPEDEAHTLIVLGDPVLGVLSRDVPTKREAAEQTHNEETKGRE